MCVCLQKIHDGVCDDGYHDAVDSDVVTNQRSASCPFTCDLAVCCSDNEAVCGSDGRNYVNMCQLQHRACISGSNLQMIHEGIKLETGAVKMRK